MKKFKLNKLNKKKIVWISSSLVLLAGTGVFVYLTRFRADEALLAANQVASVAYVDYKSGQGAAMSESSNMAGIEKVDVPTLATDFQAVSGNAKANISGQIIIKNKANAEIGQTALSTDADGKSIVDWTDVSGLDVSQNYNLVVKSPGFLPKHIDDVKLNSTDTINSGKIYGGDSSGDGTVNISDFAVMMNNWGKQNERTDYNRDGTTNISDFAVMLGNWNKTEANQ